MDEPFASLDEELKKDLRHETKKILNNSNQVLSPLQLKKPPTGMIL